MEVPVHLLSAAATSGIQKADLTEPQRWVLTSHIRDFVLSSKRFTVQTFLNRMHFTFLNCGLKLLCVQEYVVWTVIKCFFFMMNKRPVVSCQNLCCRTAKRTAFRIICTQIAPPLFLKIRRASLLS